jgi:PAS domain S-box-containing protein
LRNSILDTQESEQDLREREQNLRETGQNLRETEQNLREARLALAESKDWFRLLVEGVTDYAIYMLDPLGHVVTWNVGAERSKGYKAEEILGRNYSIFFLPEDAEAGMPARELAVAARDGRYETEGWRLRKDGAKFWALVTVTAIRDAQGELCGFAKVTRDMTQQKLWDDAQTIWAVELEDRVQERTMQLEANMEELRRKNAEVQACAQAAAHELQEKEVLFREIHHRVKNNLQVVQSLLKMQVRALPPSEARAAIEAMILRIRSMATVHERLYQMPNLAGLPLAGYVRDIFNGVIASYSIHSGRIKFHLDAEEIRLNLENAIPFGLLANELLSNSVKHGFPAGKKGTISVSAHREGDAVRMVIQDNGIGLPMNFDAGSCQSMGLKLAQSLAHQLGGALRFTSNRGCHVDGVFTRL